MRTASLQEGLTTSSSDVDWLSPSRPAGWAEELPSWASLPFEERAAEVAEYLGNALDESLARLEAEHAEPLDDLDQLLAINHPAHYAEGWSNGAEVIDITEHLNFNRGNAIKYVARAGRKNPDTEIEDLRKAAWYIDREIERLWLSS